MTAAIPSTFRDDPRSWEIYGDEKAGAVVRAAEALGLLLLETEAHTRSHRAEGLTDDERLALRALGSLSGRIAESRLRYLTGAVAGAAPPDPTASRMAALVGILAEWWLRRPGADPDLARKRTDPTSPPTVQGIDLSGLLDEFWAAAVFTDRQFHAGGISGPGILRTLLRGD